MAFKFRGKCAASIGVLDAVQISGGLICDSGWEMNSADEAHGARRQRRLVIAEKSAGSRQGDGYVVGIFHDGEIAERRVWRIRLAKYGQNFSLPVGHRNDHGVRRGRKRSGRDDLRDFGLR